MTAGTALKFRENNKQAFTYFFEYTVCNRPHFSPGPQINQLALVFCLVFVSLFCPYWAKSKTSPVSPLLLRFERRFSGMSSKHVCVDGVDV